MKKPNYTIDLHCHTNRSDGADTPKELVDQAAEAGMKVIAITDHDVRPMGWMRWNMRHQKESCFFAE